jgi:hypothetical protein
MGSGPQHALPDDCALQSCLTGCHLAGVAENGHICIAMESGNELQHVVRFCMSGSE